MKKAIIFLVFLVLLGGAVYFYINSAKKSVAPAANQATQKVGTTTKAGLISQVGTAFFIQEEGGSPVEIDSYSVELANYVGQTVEVSGQYSGDTLFVSEITTK